MDQLFAVEPLMHLVNQMHIPSLETKAGIKGMAVDKVLAIGAEVVKLLVTNCAKFSDEVEMDKNDILGKTKADALKDIDVFDMKYLLGVFL
eukprot:14542318-Heterocapsa_arctica.AAC.1